ncbi:16S rRNA (guanine(1207)-N(2))-methyltransferase RsmC [Buchnera aphidicola]|uniref:16S rRNA (guanine(1207)-N(2))-methyltransferase RsmC n=1 Tax=Buchnera aphidicola TaxID=9 RepID=UPI0034644AC2
MFIAKTSQLLLRHAMKFNNKSIFFSGNIQDYFPAHLSALKKTIHIQKYYDQLSFHMIKNHKNVHICYEHIVTEKITKDYNVLIYYWPKNKNEAYFQLMNLLSCFSIGTKIFLIGNNSSGINSASRMLFQWLTLKTLDRAKHSILNAGILLKKPIFIFENFFKTHIYNDISVKTLPGIFDYKNIDSGSKFLASTFSNKMKGPVLDMGCGSGFLSVLLEKNVPNINLTLVDNNIYALASSLATLRINRMNGKILLSDLYSNIFKKFNIIISNPPFHNDLKVNFNIVKNIISNASKYLMINGELRFVTNSCFSYKNILSKHFKKYKILKQNSKYRVYQAFLS